MSGPEAEGQEQQAPAAAAAPDATTSSKPAWGGWGKPRAPAASVMRPSLAELMDEQLAERLQNGGESSAASGAQEAAAAAASVLDPDLALALALSMSEQQSQQEGEAAAAASAQGEEVEAEAEGGGEADEEEEEEEEEDPDLALARRLAAEVEEGQQDAIDADLALAMLLQEEEERAAAVAARDERKRRARQTLGDGGQYSKVQLAFQEEMLVATAAVPRGEGGGRVLLGEADAVGMAAGSKEEEEEGEDDDPLGLGGLTAVGGRRRRRGELLRTAGGEVVTKHDPSLNARANALELAMRYQGVGDLEGEASMRVPTRAFNSLKHDLRRQAGTLKGVAARGKMETATRATQEGVLDARTRLILFKMINRAEHVSEVQGVVKTGKESYIYFAPAVPAPSSASSSSSSFVVGGAGAGGGGAGAPVVVDLTGSELGSEEEEEDNGVDEEEEQAASEWAAPAARSRSSGRAAADAVLPPLEWDRSRGCAVKVFKTTLNEFSNRAQYVEGDPRYHQSLRFNKQTSRKMFTLWGEKEYRNLVRMHRAGIPCPVPLEQREHVLVMSFLGTHDGWPSPQLREAQLSPKAWGKCYRRVCRLVRDMYQCAGLVHADLSEYNILLHEGRPFVIDVGQAVRTAHPGAMQYLKRDIRHVNAFFAKHVDAGIVGDAALLAFVRMRRPRGDGGDGEEGEEEREGGGEEEEEEEAAAKAHVVDAVLGRLMEGVSFEAAVAGTGFVDPGGRAGQEEEEELKEAPVEECV